MRRRRRLENSIFTYLKYFTKDFFASPFFLGIDIGSFEVRIYLKERGVILKEKTYVVENIKNKEFIVFGDEAYDMLGKTPPNLRVFSPIEKGRVSNFEAVVYLLQKAVDRGLAPYQKGGLLKRFDALFAVPLGLTEVEEMAIVEVGKKVGARRVFLVETPLAAGFGTGAPVMENSGSLIVDIGGGTTEISVISLGGVVLYKILKIGGHDFNAALTNYLRLRYGLLIGEKTAEETKLMLGSVFAENKERVIEISGRSLETGMPKTIKIKNSILYEPLYPYFGQIIEAIREAIEETPPELIKDIHKTGITIVGAGGGFNNLDKYFEQELKLSAKLVAEPGGGVVKGLGWLIEHESVLDKVAIKFSKM